MSNELTTISNPYGAPAPMATNHSTAVASAREAQEVQAMVFMAKQFPRDERAAMDRILMACTRPGLVAQAVYTYSRGGDVSGPSIRLAEAIARHWGNLDYGFRELEQSNGESTVEAVCWDIETNTRARRVFKVPHMRYTKHGSYPLTDPRDIYETVANNAARRLRACILEMIPGDVVDAAVAQCKATQEAEVKKGKPIAERVKDMVKLYEEIGVSRKMLEGYVGRSLDSITPALLVKLANVYKAIKDGIATVEDYFDAVILREAEKAEKRAKRASAVDVVKKTETAQPQAEAAPQVEAAEETAEDYVPMP